MSPHMRSNLQHHADQLLLGGKVSASLIMYRRLGADESATRLRRVGNAELAKGNSSGAIAAFVAASVLALARSRN